jgi:hypothetical protein
MNSYKYLLFGIFSCLMLSGMVFAEGAAGVTDALSALCTVLATALPVAIMLLVVLAAITYAVGQMLGAETRARATVWATAMMTGAIMAALIFIIVPYIIKLLMPEMDFGNSICGTSTSSGSDTWGHGGTGGTSYTTKSACEQACVGKTKSCVVDTTWKGAGQKYICIG